MLTALDRVANQNHLQLLKAVVPYIRPENQELISVCIKMIEMQNILRFFGRNRQCISACSPDREQPDILEILSDIRNYCEDGEQETLDQWIQILSAMELYSVFAQSQEEAPAEAPTTSEEKYE